MTISRYFDGSIAQLIERAKLMTAKIPRDLPRAYDTLAQTCRNLINSHVADLRRLNDVTLYGSEANQSERVRKFRRIVADLDFIETVGIAALKKAQRDDHGLNSLLERIAREIAYPIETPVVTPLSHSYFHIFPQLRLLRVPLVEGHFLLHLPDLYHELAHPLLSEENDPLIEPLQKKFAVSIRRCLQYIRTEQTKEDRRNTPSKTMFMLRAWESSWARFWLTEFYCDLFGTFTAGPAFAWSHLHLAAKRGEDPFAVPEFSPASHPADDARMRMMLTGLRLNGFPATDIDELETAWRGLLAATDSRREPEYDWCYPDSLLAQICADCFTGLRDSHIQPHSGQIKDTVAALLNRAWKRFWINPADFASWEQKEARSLLAECAKAESNAFM